MENFRTPYRSRSISEFWRRWHISLSTWFRDYLYIPLGGGRVSTPRWYTNLLITFTVSGLWHGAAWTYVVWGALNGVYLVVGILTKSSRDRMFRALGFDSEGRFRSVVGVVCTFALACAAWVVFRAQSVPDAWYILTHFWRGWDTGSIRTEQFLLRQMPVALLSIAVLELIQVLHGRYSLARVLGRWPVAVRWPVYAGFVLVVVLFGVYRKSQFIYFQF
jgi:D-alanyl-lipoteichoic acid acyltransferase DltB (MBOAT superfamily)